MFLWRNVRPPLVFPFHVTFSLPRVTKNTWILLRVGKGATVCCPVHFNPLDMSYYILKLEG